MPVYQCLAPGEFTTPENRDSIAGEFTRIHSTVTAAPPEFVNVIFVDLPDGRTYTAGKPVCRSLITGFIRSGRDEQTRARLLTQLSDAWSQITGQPTDQLILGLIDVEPTSAMEAGMILPAPGHEAQWAVQNAGALEKLRNA